MSAIEGGLFDGQEPESRVELSVCTEPPPEELSVSFLRAETPTQIIDGPVTPAGLRYDVETTFTIGPNAKKIGPSQKIANLTILSSDGLIIPHTPSRYF